MMPKPRNPKAVGNLPFQLRVVGYASMLPEPCRLTIPGVGVFDFDIVTQKELEDLTPDDGPEEFEPLRAGVHGRIRRVADYELPPRPGWMD